jgi:hypothetical protein
VLPESSPACNSVIDVDDVEVPEATAQIMPLVLEKAVKDALDDALARRKIDAGTTVDVRLHGPPQGDLGGSRQVVVVEARVEVHPTTRSQILGDYGDDRAVTPVARMLAVPDAVSLSYWLASPDARLKEEVAKHLRQVHVQRALPCPEDFQVLFEEEPQVRAIGTALDQAILKPFEPAEELVELQMNFLWVVCMAPIHPIGVFPTLLARLVETYSDMKKLLWVRQRPFPSSDELARRLMIAFTIGTIFLGLAWTIGLSLLTYNDDLWRMDQPSRTALMCAIFFGMTLEAPVMLLFLRESLGSSSSPPVPTDQMIQV